MFWLTKFIQRGGDLKGAIREFTRMNGRMPRTSEMNKMLQAFGTKGDFKGWTPKVIEGGKSEPKVGLGEFTKKEDVYEGMIDPKSDTGKKLADIRRALKEKELQKAAEEVGLGELRKSFTKKYPPHKVSNELGFRQKEYPPGVEPGSTFAKAIDESEAYKTSQLKLRMERENREAAERIRKKKAEEDKLSIFTDERPPKDPEFASGGIARVGLGKGGWLLKFLQGKLGKKAITTADKLKRPEKAVTREAFEAFNKRYDKNRKLTDEEWKDYVEENSYDLSRYEEELTGNETIAQLDDMIAESRAYEADMFSEYKSIGGSKRAGGPKDPMADAIENASPGYTGDLKYDAQILADDLAEQRFGKEFNDLSRTQQSDLYSESHKALSGQRADYIKNKNLSKPTETLKSIEETGSIDISDPNVADEFTKFMRETDPQGFKELEQKIQINTFDPKGKKGHASGGRAGYYTGGITDVKPDMSDIGHGSDSLMSRTRLVSPNSMATTSTGLNYLLAEDNDNVRIPYAKGGVAKILGE